MRPLLVRPDHRAQHSPRAHFDTMDSLSRNRPEVSPTTLPRVSGQEDEYAVINRRTILWARGLITRQAEERDVDPLEVEDVLRELNDYDPLDVILEEAKGHVPSC